MHRRTFLATATSIAMSPTESNAAPEQLRCDVFVYGSTPGGVTAATEAARQGARVIHFELQGVRRKTGPQFANGATDPPPELATCGCAALAGICGLFDAAFLHTLALATADQPLRSGCKTRPLTSVRRKSRP